jgi:hypothetical protein
VDARVDRLEEFERSQIERFDLLGPMRGHPRGRCPECGAAQSATVSAAPISLQSRPYARLFRAEIWGSCGLAVRPVSGAAAL